MKQFLYAAAFFAIAPSALAMQTDNLTQAMPHDIIHALHRLCALVDQERLDGQDNITDMIKELVNSAAQTGDAQERLQAVELAITLATEMAALCTDEKQREIEYIKEMLFDYSDVITSVEEELIHRVRPYATPAVFYGPVSVNDSNGNPALSVNGAAVFSSIVANSITANSIVFNSPLITNLTVDNLTVEDSLTLAYLSTNEGSPLIIGPGGLIQAGTSIQIIDGDSGSVTGSTVTFHANSTAGSTVQFAQSPSSTSIMQLLVSDSSGDTAIGASATAMGGNGTAIGATANAFANAASLGYGANASANGSISVGYQAAASTRRAIALGYQAAASTGDDAIALGANATASSGSAIALGSVSTATAGQAVAIATGANAGASNAIAIGYSANANAADAVAVGTEANGSGVSSVAVGSGASATGEYGTAIGSGADAGASGIALGYDASAAANSIVIGTQGTQTSCYIAGISGATVTPELPVLINTTTGQLGTISSSKRYKDNIVPMPAMSDALMQLNPVTFYYKSDPAQAMEYGLIAEEVNEVLSALVVCNETGEIESVRYHILPSLLIKGWQEQQNKIEDLQNMVTDLSKRLACLEVAAA